MAQLIDARSDVQRWADKFQGALEDVFEIQERRTAPARTPSIPAAVWVERWRRLPPVDPAKLRSDLDHLLDRSL